MNAMEYHKSSEINIAITPLVLILGLEYDMDGNEYDASKAEAFYLDAGDTVEVYATPLHYCPCQVEDTGFKCIVGLPKTTNEPLSKAYDDKLLRNKNKWLICHEGNTGLINKGVYPGIHGENHKISY